MTTHQMFVEIQRAFRAQVEKDHKAFARELLDQKIEEAKAAAREAGVRLTITIEIGK